MTLARRAAVAGIALAACAAWPLLGRAFSNVQPGETVENVSLPTLDGKRHDLLARGARANVMVFFRPHQERSDEALRWLAALEREVAGKPVHFVGVVSDSFPAADVRATVAAAGIRMPVGVDVQDALYGKLGVRLHPVVGILDGAGKLVAYEPYREINYADRVRARVRLLLGEITQAEVDQVDDPAASVTRTDEGVARRRLNYARKLLEMGDADRALEEAQKSLDLSPLAAAHALRGKILAAKGKCAEALPAFEAALKLDARDPVALEGKRGCGR